MYKKSKKVATRYTLKEIQREIFSKREMIIEMWNSKNEEQQKL